MVVYSLSLIEKDKTPRIGSITSGELLGNPAAAIRAFQRGGFLIPKGFGAGEGTRTLDINLGKVALYQLSYTRVKRGEA